MFTSPRLHAPEFSGRGGIVRARALFGARLPAHDIYQRYLSKIWKEADHEATAKLFMHGRSQAVRLPKEFRFEGSEVRVSKVGDKVILEPLKKQPFDAEAWFARLDELGGRDFLPEGLPDDPPVEPDPRVFLDE